MLIPEVTNLRHIMALLIQNPGTEAEILKFTKHTLDRFSDLGPELFFGKGAAGSRELNWFSGHSWNMGLKMAKQGSYGLSAQFFEMAADFYEAQGESLGDGNRSSACRSLVLSVAAILAEEQKNESLSDAVVQKAIQMVTKVGKVSSPIWITSQPKKIIIHKTVRIISSHL